MSADFKVTALIAAFNEADVIAEVIEHLIAQRVDVYVIDDGSSDETASIVERYVGRGVIGMERRAHSSDTFSWTDLLQRKETLAAELDSRWFIHHDADELRESPSPGLDLHAAIEAVDRLGYNAITFRVLNFPPTGEAVGPGAGLRDRFRFYEPAPRFDEVQVKCWRKGGPVDLRSSGGHQARFDGRRICPIPFLTLHYPIRSQAHGERKVFQERQPRFAAAERAAGWHVQYDAVVAGHSFVRDPATLVPFDLEMVRRDLTFALPGEELRARDGALQATRLLLQSANDARARLEAAAADDQRAINALVAQRSQDRSRLEGAEKRAEIAEQATQAAEQRARVAEERAKLEKAAALRAQTDAAVRATDAARAREELTDVYRSRSWRATRLLRAINTLVTNAPAAASDRRAEIGPVSVRWGDLARVTPLSDRWGFDRGLPIDRYYIRQFLERHAADIRGRVLEVKDANYARSFGGSGVASIDVLDIDGGNPHATVVADLANAGRLDGGRFDCFILTQTLHIIFDIRGAVREAARLLAAGGVLLCTIPAVSRVSDEDGGLDSGDYWRMTRAAVLRLFGEAFAPDAVDVATCGNVRTCAAFLYGIAAEELDVRDLSMHDPWFPLIHCIRAVKRT